MPSNSFAFTLPSVYGIRGCQEDLNGFLKTLINHFHQGIKVFWGKGKRKFSKIMHSVCRVMVKGFCRCIGPIKLRRSLTQMCSVLVRWAVHSFCSQVATWTFAESHWEELQRQPASCVWHGLWSLNTYTALRSLSLIGSARNSHWLWKFSSKWFSRGGSPFPWVWYQVTSHQRISVNSQLCSSLVNCPKGLEGMLKTQGSQKNGEVCSTSDGQLGIWY